MGGGVVKCGKRIAQLRTNAGLTQEQLAKYLHITRSRLAHYENDRREPDHQVLRMLADYFDVSADYLLGITDTPWGRILTKKEKLAFLPPEIVDDLDIKINGKKVTENIKTKILESLRKEGII